MSYFVGLTDCRRRAEGCRAGNSGPLQKLGAGASGKGNPGKEEIGNGERNPEPARHYPW